MCESPKELGWVSPSSPAFPVWCQLQTSTCTTTTSISLCTVDPWALLELLVKPDQVETSRAEKWVASTKNCKSLFGHWRVRLAPNVSKSPCEPINAQPYSRNKHVNSVVQIFNLLKPIFLLKTPVQDVNNYITNSFNIYQGLRFCVFRGVAALSDSWP